MKAVLEPIFVLFYVTSAFAASQIRTVELIEKIQDANSRSDDQTIERACSKDADNLPHYRDAKKAPNEFQCYLVWKIDLTPAEAEILALNDFSYRADFRLMPSHSRAPPALD